MIPVNTDVSRTPNSRLVRGAVAVSSVSPTAKIAALMLTIVPKKSVAQPIAGTGRGERGAASFCASGDSGSSCTIALTGRTVSFCPHCGQQGRGVVSAVIGLDHDPFSHATRVALIAVVRTRRA